MEGQSPPSGGVPTVQCDHCELIFRADQSYPVTITGGQSYAGHILQYHGGPRHVWLCRTCYGILRAANIGWLRVEDDHEREIPVTVEDVGHGD